jgi:hypothetical protein
LPDGFIELTLKSYGTSDGSVLLASAFDNVTGGFID